MIHREGYTFDLLDIDLHKYDDAYVESHIQSHSYDVVMLGSIVTHYKWIKWCTNMIKKHQPSCKIIIGNSVGSSIPELFLTESMADVVVCGEGEFSALDALKAISAGTSLEKILGIAYRSDNGEIRINPPRPACDINELPMINWDLFEVQKYLEISDADGALGAPPNSDKWVIMPVSTARGCIARCTFCHFVYWNDPYRHRSPESILAEIRRNIEEYGANYINFWDDLSFSSVNSAEKVVDAIIESGLKFHWSAAVRTDLFGNPKFPYEKRLRVAKKFKESGCMGVGYSLESGNKEILEMMNKRVEVEYFEEQVRILNEAGIKSYTSVVLGYPIETKDTIRETFEMCLKNSLYPSIGFLLPLPGTEMYKYAKEHGFISDEDKYLTSITERQDICLNMTTLSDNEIIGEIKNWAGHLNDVLQLGLDKDRLIKTGGYRKHDHQKSDEIEDLKRNENDMSFNYSEQVFSQKPNRKC